MNNLRKAGGQQLPPAFFHERKGVEQMAKGKTTAFFCQNCGYESAKWMGQCPACREWNTFVEEPVVKTTGTKTSAAAGSTRRMQLQEPSRLVSIKPQENLRISTGMEELGVIIVYRVQR